MTRLADCRKRELRAVNPVVSVADFANRGREYPLRMTQRHEQPVTDGRLDIK